MGDPVFLRPAVQRLGLVENGPGMIDIPMTQQVADEFLDQVLSRRAFQGQPPDEAACGIGVGALAQDLQFGQQQPGVLRRQVQRGLDGLFRLGQAPRLGMVLRFAQKPPGVLIHVRNVQSRESRFSSCCSEMQFSHFSAIRP